MDNQLLITLTQLSDFIGLAIAVWLMFYLLGRGYSNPLTLNMAVILLALSFFFYFGFSNSVLQANTPVTNTSFTIVVAAASAYYLTYQLLPLEQRAKQKKVLLGILLFAFVAALNLLLVAPQANYQPDQIYFIATVSPQIIVDLFDLSAALGVLYNLYQIFKSKSEILHTIFYAALFFGISTIGFGTASILFQILVPRFITNLLLISAFLLLGYSIGRYQSLVDKRVSIRDFPIIAVTFTLLSLVYGYAALQWGLPPSYIALLVILAIGSHSVYDLIRELLHRSFSKSENSLRRELRQLSRAALPNSLEASLHRSLAILCHNLDAKSGFIALEIDGGFIISASYHALPMGSQLQINHPIEEEMFQATEELAEYAEWICRIYAGNQPIGVVAVGPRAEMRTYTDSDLGWIEDICDQIGNIVQTHYQSTDSTATQMKPNKLLSTLALQPNSDLLKSVEEGFRNLNDFIKLGDSTLTAYLGITGDTHISRGKAVQEKLIDTLESLRPTSESPSEPIAREWYSYTILNQAYVEDVPDRDIMAKLFISEGTYYRTRRKALRGISRALMEAEALG